MAEAGGEVVEVVVEPLVPVRVGGVDAGDLVELREEGGGLVEVGLPGRVGAADAVGGVERVGGGTGVGWFEGVDGVGLDGDLEGFVGGGGIHAQDELAGDLGGDYVVCYAKADFAGVEGGW